MTYAEKARAHRLEHLTRAQGAEEFARRFYADEPQIREMVEKMARWDRRRATRPYWLVLLGEALGHWSALLVSAAFLWAFWSLTGVLHGWLPWCFAVAWTVVLVTVSVATRRARKRSQRSPG